jgi:prepilin-type N-terminal cleavage/methylation domain-containing protein
MESLRRDSAGFSFFEILITIIIIGILAAIIIPEFRDQSIKAKEAAAKETLLKLRNVIELYATQHKGVPPGYPNGDMSKIPQSSIFTQQLCMASNSLGQTNSESTEDYGLGPYLSAIPENPFNDSDTVTVYRNNATFPASANSTSGWRYKPLTKTIKFNYSGTDSEGVEYYDY